MDDFGTYDRSLWTLQEARDVTNIGLESKLGSFDVAY